VIPLAQEATLSARSQPVASLLTVLTVAGMIVAVMLTTGRTVGAERQVLASIDSAGTRTLVIQAQQGAGVTSAALQRILRLDGIEWAGAFSSAMDATNSLIPDGVRVPVRRVYSRNLRALGVPARLALPNKTAYASAQAAQQLGLAQQVGSITLTNGADYTVAGKLEVPDFLRILEPLVVVPTRSGRGDDPVSVIVIVAASPELVAPLNDAVLPLVAAEDIAKVTVQTSENLAQLRALVQGQLGTFSRGLVLAVLTLTGILVAALLYGLVMMRRKDFGRRRALGATRTWIVLLLLTQTTVLALLGILIGIAASTLILIATNDPLPGLPFTAALALLSIITALVAALIPAVTASRREPIRELRVP
jgi:putative ABC transport system permease protein